MAGRSNEVNSSGFEFLQDEVKYKRSGGCFVTTKKAIIYLIITIISSILVGVFLYFYGPTDHTVQKVYTKAKPDDIEKLLNDSIESIPMQEVRLPNTIHPLHYKLNIHPIIDAYQPNNFTFSGQVSILLRCTEETKEIALNSVNLNISSVELVIADPQRLNTRSARSVPEVMQGEHTANTTGLAPPSTTPSSSILVLTTVKAKQQEVNISTNSTKLVHNTSEATPSSVSANLGATPSQFGNLSSDSSIPGKDIGLFLNSSASSTYDAGDSYVKGSSDSVEIEFKREDRNDSQYVIRLKQALELGKNYSLTIKFSGKITNNIRGLYAPSYVDEKGEKRWILATNFEPVFAREVFPCFDEPSFKATFETSVARRTNMTSISNMPLRATETMNTPGWVWDHFEATPLMPTYLVSFAVLDLERKNASNTTGGPLFSVWAPNNKIHNAGYALESGVKIIKFLEKYFGINYSLPKIDLVAIPDLPKVTMESWGLIFFRDTSILLSNRSSDFETKQQIFNALAQELAQQWFGNLVTLDWWNDLWLTEGFSIFMAEEVEESVEDWVSDYSLRITQYTLNNDDFKSSHSLRVNITNTLEINALLDSVAHYKGSCLLRMLNYSLSEDTFRKGVRKYLTQWSGGSASQIDFWDSVTQSVSNKNDLPENYTIEKIMDSWTTQTGYPLVTVKRDYAMNAINISQMRFQVLNNSDDGLWIIPLDYVVGNSSNGVEKLWLTNRSITLNNISGALNNSWVLFNIEETGYYRVNYDIQNWRVLEQALKADPNNIPLLNRGQLLNDAFELSENGILDYEIPFELAQYLINERNYIPWTSVLNSLNVLHNILHTTYLNGAYEDYVINLISNLYNEMGPNEKQNESSNDKMLRTVIVKTACDVRYQPCVDWARSQFQAWMDSSYPYIPIPFNIRQTVLCTAIEMGGQIEWDFLWNKISPTMTSLDVQDAYMSLGCSRDVWLINRKFMNMYRSLHPKSSIERIYLPRHVGGRGLLSLECMYDRTTLDMANRVLRSDDPLARLITKYLLFTLNGTIPWQNVPLVWQSIAHSTGISVGFTFLRENWSKIYKAYEDKVLILRSIVTNFLYSLSTEVDLEDLTLFFSKHDDDLQSLSTLIQGVVDRINVRINWTKKYIDSIASWLSANNYK